MAHLLVEAITAPLGYVSFFARVTPLVERVSKSLRGAGSFPWPVVVTGVLPAYRAFHIDLQTELVKNGNFCIILYFSVFFRLYLEGERLSAGPLE